MGIGARMLLALYVAEMLTRAHCKRTWRNCQEPASRSPSGTMPGPSSPTIASAAAWATPPWSSTYLPPHVPYVHHVHNLYLQVAMEQGVPAVVALLGMFGSALWALRRPWRSSRELRLPAAAVFVALVSLLAGGLLDAELYAGRLVFLLFVPIGSAWALHRRATVTARYGSGRPGRLVMVSVGARRRAALRGGRLVLWPVGPPNLLLNIGAVRQTQAELRAYHWPDTDFQDRVRRRHEAELLPAVAAHAGACTRSGQRGRQSPAGPDRALRQGAYATAAAHLSAAYAQDPDAWIVCRLWGESLALTGSPARCRCVAGRGRAHDLVGLAPALVRHAGRCHRLRLDGGSRGLLDGRPTRRTVRLTPVPVTIFFGRDCRPNMQGGEVSYATLSSVRA
ncbi:MAG: hypothetical protein R3A10_16600 [Caldilineaceae bacterium]